MPRARASTRGDGFQGFRGTIHGQPAVLDGTVPECRDTVTTARWRLASPREQYVKWKVKVVPASALELVVRFGLASLIDPFIGLCGQDARGIWRQQME